jgi:hypothetical protein
VTGGAWMHRCGVASGVWRSQHGAVGGVWWSRHGAVHEWGSRVKGLFNFLIGA